MKKVIEVIAERCLGCHTCELECALAHGESKTLIQALQSGERLFPRIVLENVRDITYPMHCRHCSDAPCITVCPTKAMSRENADSPVVLDPESCIGCRACILACPFGIIQTVQPEDFLTKCDLCSALLAKGEEPACAASCPTGAIRYLPLDELNEEKRKEVIGRFKVALAQRENMEN